MAERAEPASRVSALLRSAVVVGALAAAGCGSSDGGSTAASAGGGAKTAEIAYLTYTIADYQQAMVDGMKAKVAPGGGDVTVFNANYDTQKQQQQCQDAVQSGRYDVVVLASVTPATGVPCVTTAKAADVPVITLEYPVGQDLDAVEPTVEGNVKAIVTKPASNARGYGELTRLACAGKDPCEVVAEVATPNDPVTNAWIDGVAEVPGVEVVQRMATQFDPALLGRALPDALSAHPGTDVFVSTADFGALAAVPVIKAAGKGDAVKILGNGASRSGVAAIRDGRLFGTVATWPRQMGELAGTAAVEAAAGEQISGPAGVDAYEIDQPLVVTQDNVGEMKPEWGAN